MLKTHQKLLISIIGDVVVVLQGLGSNHSLLLCCPFPEIRKKYIIKKSNNYGQKNCIMFVKVCDQLYFSCKINHI